ncbi:MAG: hypothetical protein ACE5IR_23860 [bacterium]
MKLLKVSLFGIGLFLFSGVYGQDRFQPSFLVGGAAYKLNGDYELLPGVGFGLSYKPLSDNETLRVGAHLLPTLSEKSDDTNGALAFVLNVTVWKMANLGFGWEFWQEGHGIDKPVKKDLFLFLSYDAQ